LPGNNAHDKNQHKREKEGKGYVLATEDTENTEILFYKEGKRKKRERGKGICFSHRGHRRHRDFILQRGKEKKERKRERDMF